MQRDIAHQGCAERAGELEGGGEGFTRAFVGDQGVER